MTFTRIALAASALLIAAPAFAQTPLSQEPTKEQRQGLNPLASSNPESGAGKVDPGGDSGTLAGRTTATGGNPGGAAGRN